MFAAKAMAGARRAEKGPSNGMVYQSRRRSGVRPFRWTASCCGFDQALGVLILEVDGAAVAES